MKLAIVGTHTIEQSRVNYLRMKSAVLLSIDISTITEITSGGAKGIDTFGEDLAAEYKIPTKIFKAEWNRYGRGAGPKRNTYIVDECDVMIAFPDKQSVGTLDSMKKAKIQNKLKEIWWWESIDKDLSEANKFL